VANTKWSPEYYESLLKSSPNWNFTNSIYAECAYGHDPETQIQNQQNEARHIQNLCETRSHYAGFIAQCVLWNGRKATLDWLDSQRDSSGKLSPYLKGLRAVHHLVIEEHWYCQDMKDGLQVLQDEGLIWEIGPS